MSVLPHSATLLSFFVVLVVFFLITLLLGVNLSKPLTAILPALQNSKSRLDIFSKLFAWTRGYIQGYVDVLTPPEHLELNDRPSSKERAEGKPFLYRLYCFFRRTLTVLMRDCLIPEIL